MTYHAPQFLTFTGADDNTRYEEMRALHERFRAKVEFGVLLHHGNPRPRYPSHDWVKGLIEFENKHMTSRARMQLAAHVCGAYSKTLIEMGKCPAIEPLLKENAFQSVQVNTSDPRVLDRLPDIRNWLRGLDIYDVIIQTRNPERFPDEVIGVSWLYDVSGGRGVKPQSWPVGGDTDGCVGYAGGISRANIQALCQEIGSHTNLYWLDMETGCRDESDRFSLDICQQLCEMSLSDLESPMLLNNISVRKPE